MCVAVLTPLEYLDAKQRDRAERTLQYVERYGDGEYAKSALMLDEAIDIHYAELQKLLTNPELTAAELEQQYHGFILQLFKDAELRTAINQLLRFHEELVQCVVNELCDEEIASSFFANSTGELLRTYYPYICDRRSKWNDPKAYQVVEKFYLKQPNTELCKVAL